MHAPRLVGERFKFFVTFQIGNEQTKSFIAFFALYKEVESLIELGARFHMCMASFTNVF